MNSCFGGQIIYASGSQMGARKISMLWIFEVRLCRVRLEFFLNPETTGIQISFSSRFITRTSPDGFMVKCQ